MPTPLEFLTEFAKEIIQPGNELHRRIIVAGYAKHMEARENALKGAVSNV